MSPVSKLLVTAPPKPNKCQHTAYISSPDWWSVVCPGCYFIYYILCFVHIHFGCCQLSSKTNCDHCVVRFGRIIIIIIQMVGFCWTQFYLFRLIINVRKWKIKCVSFTKLCMWWPFRHLVSLVVIEILNTKLEQPLFP